MDDKIVERLRYEAWHNPSEGDTADAHYLAADALAEIERLQRLIKDYAKARKGITLNWTVDRFDNWSALADADQALIEEAVILAWPETLRKQAPHG